MLSETTFVIHDALIKSEYVSKPGYSGKDLIIHSLIWDTFCLYIWITQNCDFKIYRTFV